MASYSNYEEPVGIKSLPTEIIHKILENSDLHMRDVLNFSATCKQLNETVKIDNLLWKRKFFQRWLSTRDDFEEQRDSGYLLEVDWQEQSKHRILCRKSLLRKISRLTSTHGIVPDLPPSSMQEFDCLFLVENGASPLNYHYLTDMLNYLIGQSQRRSLTLEGEQNFKSIINETLQIHYARLINKYQRNMYFSKKWRSFLSLPKEQQTMEQGAMFVTRWSQTLKRISSRQVSLMLDEIACKTRNLIQDKYPLVPINSVATSELARWRTEMTYENKWNVKDSTIIFTTLYEAMYGSLGFYGINPVGSTMYSMFIDNVLKYKYGHPLLLAIIFESVARRLGLHCEIVSYGERFLIQWTEKSIYNTEDTDVKAHYIDLLTAERFEDVDEFLRRNSIEERTINHESSVAKITQRMFACLKSAAGQINDYFQRFAHPREPERKILESAFKLMLQLKPNNETIIDHFASFYERHEMSLTELVKTLSSMLSMGSIRVEEHFPTSQAIKILRHITMDLYQKDREVRQKLRIRRWRAMKRSVIPCQCCKRLRAFAEKLKRQRIMRTRLGRIVVRRQ